MFENDNNSMLNKPIFVVGYPKSGTTLLTALLDNHPDLVVFPEELKFFQRVTGPSFRKNISKQEKKAILYKFCLHKLQINRNTQDNTGNRNYAGIDFKHFQGQFDALFEKAENDKEILLSVIGAFMKSIDCTGNNKKFWVEKTPYNNYYYPIISEWFPDPIILHMVRNPYDNYFSYKNKNFKNLTTNRFCLDVAFSDKLIKHAQKKINKYKIIQYEDLVINTEEVMHEVCNFIGINFNKTLLEPSFLGEAWFGNSSHGYKYKKVSSNSIGTHFDKISKEEKETIINKLKGHDFYFNLQIVKRYLFFRIKWLFPNLYKLAYKYCYD